MVLGPASQVVLFAVHQAELIGTNSNARSYLEGWWVIKETSTGTNKGENQESGDENRGQSQGQWAC